MRFNFFSPGDSQEEPRWKRTLKINRLIAPLEPKLCDSGVRKVEEKQGPPRTGHSEPWLIVSLCPPPSVWQTRLEADERNSC